MKKDDYKFSSLKHQLAARKRRGEKKVIWKVNDDQNAFIESLGYRTEPFLFSIKTRRFSYEARKDSYLLKDLHYASMENKSYITRKLKKSDQHLLDQCDVPYKAIKRTIYLQ